MVDIYSIHLLFIVRLDAETNPHNIPFHKSQTENIDTSPLCRYNEAWMEVLSQDFCYDNHDGDLAADQ